MKRILLFAILTLGTLSPAMAQKFGHADFQSIVGLMPERAAAEKEVQELQKKLEERLNSMVQTYQEKTQEFQTDTTLSVSLRTSLRNEIADMEKRIQEFQQTAYTEIDAKQSELMGKIVDKVRAAAVQVGNDGSYTYIFDSSNGAILYAGGEDVTTKVKNQLGL